VTRTDEPSATVDIACATYNGARFLSALMESILSQTHQAWRLWIRDDGSADETTTIVRDFAARDPRVHAMSDDRGRLGAAGSFAQLLGSLPPDAAYIMFADQDDVWVPEKIEHTLAAMIDAEGSAPPNQPVLVHSDLTVVDAELRTIHPSFWTYAGLQIDAPTLKRIAVRNVVTGAATMINGSLRTLASPMPRAAILHDWWCACVAAAFGTIVALRESTVLYRQHSANVVGARDWQVELSAMPSAILGSVRRTSELRDTIERTAAQARAFLDRYGARLPAEDQRFLAGYAEIPRQRFFRRKMDLLRFRMLPEYGTLRRLGILLRG
jgi:hypothetical protein